jgi:hypothetical protein
MIRINLTCWFKKNNTHLVPKYDPSEDWGVLFLRLLIQAGKRIHLTRVLFQFRLR